MKPLRHLLYPILALATLQPTSFAADAPQRKADVIEPPKVIRLKVEWPGDYDREALVLVRFRVHADGHASDFHVQDGSFTEKRFTDEVFHGMRTAKFKPAKKNGVPLDDYYAVMPFNFSMSGVTKGITPDFRKELDKVQELVSSGDNAGAHFHAQWMVAEKATLIYEYAVLQAQLAHTHARVGNIHRAMAAAQLGSQRKAPVVREFTLDDMAPPNSPSYYMLPKEVVTGLLEMRFRLAASKGMLLESIQAYQELAGLDPIPTDDPRAKLAMSVVALLKGQEPLVAQLRVDEDHEVYHKLYRRTFSIAPRTGKPDSIEMVCGDRKRELAYQPDVEWTIPANWEQCVIAVKAAPGTEFDLAEYQPGTEAIRLPEG